MTEEAPPTATDEAPPVPAEPTEASKAEAPTADEPKPVTMGETPKPPAGGPYRALPPPEPPPPPYRPNYVFLAVVSVVSLVLDLGSKAWAKARLEDPKAFADRTIEVVSNHLSFRFARNQGGAWGLLQDEPESIRRPFFLGISFLAIAFIVSLYRKLTPKQWALKWGLPLVLGGALGNLVNRVQYNYVVDFIDYRASWVKAVNGLMSPRPTDHWPTFNIADVAIVAGVILMAIDMFTPRRLAMEGPERAPAVTMGGPERAPQTPPVATGEPPLPSAAPATAEEPRPAPAPKET